MARNLAAAGHQVTGWNRTRANVPEGLDGVTIASSIAEAVREAEFVFLSVIGPPSQLDVVFDDDGLLEHAPEGCLIIDATSTAPDLTRSLHEDFAEQGVEYVDAPVFGRPGRGLGRQARLAVRWHAGAIRPCRATAADHEQKRHPHRPAGHGGGDEAGGQPDGRRAIRLAGRGAGHRPARRGARRRDPEGAGRGRFRLGAAARECPAPPWRAISRRSSICATC